MENKWSNSCLAINGKIYAAPFNSSTILCIDPANNTFNTIGNFGNYEAKWSGACTGFNGYIYFSPYTNNINQILCFNPKDETVKSLGNFKNYDTKFTDLILAENEKIYGIPFNYKHLFEINNIGNNSSSKNVFLYPWFNKM